MKKILFHITLCFLLTTFSLPLFAGGGTQETSGATRTVTDMDGTKVPLPVDVRHCQIINTTFYDLRILFFMWFYIIIPITMKLARV
jgi:hypothetical protein